MQSQRLTPDVVTCGLLIRSEAQTATMQCSMVDECGAMKRTLWWQRKHTADLCHEHSQAQQVAWTPVLRAHLSQSPDAPAPRRQAAWWHQQPPGPNFQYLAVCSLGCHLTHTLEIADSIASEIYWISHDFPLFPTISHFYFDKVFWVVCLDRAAIYSDIIYVYIIIYI